jgi:DNA-binding NarL/FixJ family response regulator
MSPSLSALTPVPATAAPRLALVEAGRPSRTIRVVVIHERRLVRAGLCALLEQDACITVVGEGASGEDVAVLGRRVQPDVLLIGSRTLAPEPLAGAATLVLGDQLADAHPVELVQAVKGAARRRPETRTPHLKLIQGGSPWNSGT